MELAGSCVMSRRDVFLVAVSLRTFRSPDEMPGATKLVVLDLCGLGKECDGLVQGANALGSVGCIQTEPQRAPPDVWGIRRRRVGLEGGNEVVGLNRRQVGVGGLP